MCSNESCIVYDSVLRDGYNSTRFVHCNVCCALWTGLARCHCNVCHETFNSTRACDSHWTRLGHLWPGNIASLTCKDGIWYGREMDENTREMFMKQVGLIAMPVERAPERYDEFQFGKLV